MRELILKTNAFAFYSAYRRTISAMIYFLITETLLDLVKNASYLESYLVVTLQKNSDHIHALALEEIIKQNFTNGDETGIFNQSIPPLTF